VRAWTTELRTRVHDLSNRLADVGFRHLSNRLTHLKGPTPAKIRRQLPVALILVGAGILVYVLSQYGLMYREQRRLESTWAKQNTARASGQLRDASMQSFDDGVTRLLIPKINLDAMVTEGIGRKQLNLGPGHMTDTPEPGEFGNAVLSAHRDTFFRHIYELSKGDTIDIRRNGKLYTYEVTGKKIVKPEDLSVLKQTPDRTLTLITCYPTYYIGPAPDRLVVFARMAEPKNQAASDLKGATAAAETSK
jgi:LPXTG-site transpeptidase (sortase) family protein